MPVLALAAALLAALVWIVPLPILRVPTAPEPAPVEPPPAPEVTETVAQAPQVEWKALSEGLDSLREKAPEMAKVEETTTEVPQIEVTHTPTAQPLGWVFKGTIDGPGSSAALLTMSDGRSRFVFEGQQLTDPTNPDGPKVIIREIGIDYLLVARGETEERLPLEKPEIMNPLSGRLSPERAGR